MKFQVRDEVWADIASELREKLGADRYERWLSRVTVLGSSEKEVRLGVPNRFFLEWIEDRYLDEIARVLGSRLGRDVKVALGIDPRLYRELKASQELELEGMDRGLSVDAIPLEPADLPRSRPFLESGARRDAAAPDVHLEDGEEPETLSTFVVGPSNRMAHAAALRVVENPGKEFNPLFIYGECGLGKTHLLRAICDALRRRCPGLNVRYLTGEEFVHRFVTSLRAGNIARFREANRAPQVLVVDDVHLLSNKVRTQEEFLHTFDSLTGAGHQVVMASDCHPRTIASLQKALQGRFLGGLVAPVTRPEPETRFAILVRLARRSRRPLADAVVRVISDGVRGNVRELIGAFHLLAATAADSARPLEAADAEQVLQDWLRHHQRPRHLPRIAERVARHYGTTVGDLVSASRRRSLALARQVAMYLGRKYTHRSLAEIGNYFGDRNHTSVRSAESKVARLLQSDPALLKDVESIIDSFDD